eukprot:6429531-Karenia_brevis.AAC.1
MAGEQFKMSERGPCDGHFEITPNQDLQSGVQQHGTSNVASFSGQMPPDQWVTEGDPWQPAERPAKAQNTGVGKGPNSSSGSQTHDNPAPSPLLLSGHLASKGAGIAKGPGEQHAIGPMATAHHGPHPAWQRYQSPMVSGALPAAASWPGGDPKGQP